jgi:hypothetical protein
MSSYGNTEQNFTPLPPAPNGRKNYLNYARKKMEIAARIGLIPQPSLEGGNQGAIVS